MASSQSIKLPVPSFQNNARAEKKVKEASRGSSELRPTFGAMDCLRASVGAACIRMTRLKSYCANPAFVIYFGEQKRQLSRVRFRKRTLLVQGLGGQIDQNFACGNRACRAPAPPLLVNGFIPPQPAEAPARQHRVFLQRATLPIAASVPRGCFR